MDDLNEVAGVTPVNLEDLVEVKEVFPAAPEASVRNRAAFTALLSDKPEKLAENYQAMVEEGMRGEDTTRKMIKNKADVKDGPMTQQTIMQILADRNISDDQKKLAINAINSSAYKDTATQVAMEAAKEPQKRENLKQEEVRISAIETFSEIYQYRKDKQAILNKHAAALNPDTQTFLTNFLETLLPFATNKVAYNVLTKAAEELKLDTSKKAITMLPGSAIMAIREAIAAVPPSKQVEVTNKLSEIISNNSNIYLRDDNDYVKYNLQKALFEEGGYSNFDKYLDNAVGLLDVIGLGGVAKSVIRGLSKKAVRTQDTLERSTVLRSVTDTTSPVAPAIALQDVSPDKARGMYQLVVKSSSDEAAKALYGTSRDEAIASVHIPQPASPSGAIEAKLIDPDRRIVDVVEESGRIDLSDAERLAATAHTTNVIKDAVGITVHDNLLTVGADGGKVNISAVFGNSNGGFNTAEEALNQVKFSLKEFGIADKDLEVLKRIDGEYVPVSFPEQAGIQGDYLVKLNMRHDINPLDIGAMDSLDVKRNFFDRIPWLRSNKAGTLANTLLDNASMLHPRISGGAVVSADKAARIDKLLLELHNEFASQYVKLPEARKNKLYNYIKEANNQGIEKDAMQLTADGFTRDEIKALNSWRKAWDTHFYLENRDAARTLAIQGYQVLDHANAKLFAKPVQKNQNIGKVYDPDTDSVRTLSKQEMDDLYNQGGTYAKLRRPTTFGNDTVEHVLIQNNSSNYLKGITPADQVLAYRKGYYQVQYKAPKFIVNVLTDAGGKEYTKAVALAGDTKEAETIAANLSAQNGGTYRVRGDVNELRPDTDYYWDLQNSSGRTAQRHRGKPLEASDAPVIFDSQYLADPVESAIRAARSLSGRVATREFLETSKQRALQQYAEFFPKNAYGEPQWVENSNSLIDLGKMSTSNIADARTTVEYLNYLQHGYANSFDEGFKGIMNAMADFSANISSGAERGFLAASKLNPTDLGKNTVFHAYIATNPLRQFLIQVHQSVRMWSYNPSYMAGDFVKDFSTYLINKSKEKLNMPFTQTAKEKEIKDFIEGSGLLDAVDKSNLVRGALTDMAEASNPVKNIAGKALALPRQIGFDKGEQGQLVAALLAVRDKFIKRGLDVNNKTVRDEIYSQTRAMTYDMNYAADMPYNQNWASMFMQFAQVPHKAITSVTTNRRIPWQDKMKFAIGDALLFGIPGATFLSNIIGNDSLPEDPVAREAVLFGIESAANNIIFSRMAGKEVNIDFSSLSPYNMDGWAAMAEAALTGGFTEMIASSPAANIYFKDGSKVQEAMGRILRYTGFYDPYEGHTPEDIYSVASGIAEISSGWSNYLKAKTIWETGKIVDKQGNPVNTNAGTAEAIAKLFGFGTQEEALNYYVSTKIREGTKQHKEEVLNWTKGYLKLLTRETQLNTQDDEFYIKVLGAAKNVWKDDYTALGIINDQLKIMAPEPKLKLIKAILESSKLPKGTISLNEMHNLKLLNDDDFNKAIKLHKDLVDSQKGNE